MMDLLLAAFAGGFGVGVVQLAYRFGHAQGRAFEGHLWEKLVAEGSLRWVWDAEPTVTEGGE
jgi:hypothetical protein